MSPSTTRPKPSKRPSLHARKSSAPKTPIHINIYDLLPPSALSHLLWPLGLSLLHTGIVLLNHEYSYGATASLPPTRPNATPQTGIFHTPPLTPPPGGTHRLTHLQGFTYLSVSEIETVIREASAKFPGESYNLLSNNCNHFTNYMCKILTGREMPAFINRAARIGTALPCLVPKEWAAGEAESHEDGRGSSARDGVAASRGPVVTYGTAYDSEDADSSPDEDERAGVAWHSGRRPPQQRYFDDPEEERRQGGQEGRVSELELRKKGQEWTKMVRDTDGRGLPASEVAPPDRLVGGSGG